MKLGHPLKIVTGPLNYPHRVTSIDDAQYIVHKAQRCWGEGYIGKGTPVINHFACAVQAPKTTRPPILLKAQGLVLGRKVMLLELRRERADQTNAAQGFPNPTCETTPPDTTIHTTNNPIQPHLVESVATSVPKVGTKSEVEPLSSGRPQCGDEIRSS